MVNRLYNIGLKLLQSCQHGPQYNGCRDTWHNDPPTLVLWSPFSMGSETCC